MSPAYLAAVFFGLYAVSAGAFSAINVAANEQDPIRRKSGLFAARVLTLLVSVAAAYHLGVAIQVLNGGAP